jgi:DNA-binding transcriptional LysR family regulator
MATILSGYEGEPDLHHLQVLDVLLREHSLTRAARTLNVTQPALSKTLARLRRYFDDPLFVRVSLRMEPTPKALQLQAPVRAILERVQSLRSEHVSFHPRTSDRTFNFCVVDAGLLKLLPPLVDRLLEEAPNVRLQVLQLDAQHLEPWLESGKLDFAMGSFASLTKQIRRQPLWVERYVSVARKGHPRIGAEPTVRAFAAEKHVLVSIPGSGHAHQTAERALEAAIPPANIIWPHSHVHRRGRGGQAHRRRCDAAVVDRRCPGEGPRSPGHHPADQTAEDRHLSVLARAVSPRSRQSMDPVDLQVAVQQIICDHGRTLTGAR